MAQTESPTSGEEVLEGSLLVDERVDLIVFKAAELADERLRLRYQRQSRRVGLAVSLVGLLGLGSVGAMLDAVVSNNVEEEVADSTVSLGAELEREIHYQQFVTLALAISDPDEEAFSRDDRDFSMTLLRELAGDSEILQRPGFSKFLEDLVDAFFSAGVRESIDEIESLYRPLLVQRPGITYTLVSHYGQIIVGSPLPVGQQQEKHIEAFARYRDSARDTIYPELDIFWSLLVELKKNDLQVSPISDEMVKDVSFLSAEDRLSFDGILEMYSSPERWQREVTAEGARIASHVEAALDLYPELREEEGGDIGALDEINEMLKGIS